jgi:Rrf2 family nitric oxide-sensitive transcriptional repressor
VLRSTEDEVLVECFARETAHCRIMPACTLPPMLREASASFYATLDQYTLADLLRPERRLDGLLSAPR